MKDRRFERGKYMGKLIRTVIRTDPQYIDYCLSEGFQVDDIFAAAENYGLNKIKMPYGKCKGKSITFTYTTERGLIRWYIDNGILLDLISLVKPKLDDIDREVFNEV